MKVFISTPMRGKTEEQIEAYRERQKRIVKAIYGDDIEFICIAVADPPDTKKKSVYFLGKSIQILADADLAVFPCRDIVDEMNGCSVEIDVCHRYGIKVVELPMFEEDKETLEEIRIRRCFVTLCDSRDIVNDEVESKLENTSAANSGQKPAQGVSRQADS